MASSLRDAAECREMRAVDRATPMSHHPCVTGQQFIDRVREIGRLRGRNVMRFVYPARLRRTGPDEVVVSFRDIPECLTSLNRAPPGIRSIAPAGSAADETEALAEAADALDVAIAGRIVYPPENGDPIPVPSARRTDEHDVAVPADTAAKAALLLALCDSGLSRSALARRLGVDVRVVRRMLDPRHRTGASRIGSVLRELGQELVVETHVPEPVR